jgi:CubicO group peptidase (beta-lactamase class C family)
MEIFSKHIKPCFNTFAVFSFICVIMVGSGVHSAFARNFDRHPGLRYHTKHQYRSPHNERFKTTIQSTTEFILQEMEESNAVGLSIALVSDDEVVWAQGFGWQDMKNDIPATADSVYMIASITKTLTAVSLLKLYEQGIVDLDTPAIQYLPEFDIAPRFPLQMQEITVRRLLNHHSGLPGDIFAAGFLTGDTWEKYGCNLYMDFLMDYLRTDYPSLPPGEKAVYSNTGFVLAGEIALRYGGIPGETFPDFMDRHLFTPLGMHHTSLRKIQKNLAQGYIGGNAMDIAQTNCTFGATGGAFSTVKDFARFMIMLNNQGKAPDGTQFLEPETVAMLGDAEVSELDIDSFFRPGLGLDSMDDAVMNYAGRAWWKNGSVAYHNSFMEILPDQKLGVVVLSNSDTGGLILPDVVQHCLKNAVKEKSGIDPVEPVLPAFDSVKDPAIIQGNYATMNGYDIITDNGDGTLTWKRNAHDPDTDAGLSILTFQDGTFKPDDQNTQSLIFKNLHRQGRDYFVMMLKDTGSNGGILFIFGEKMLPRAIPASWKDRQGVYLYENVAWNDLWFAPMAVLSEKDHMLVWDTEYVLMPENDSTAFVAGLNNRSDSSLRVIVEDGKEKLLFGGYKACSTALIPSVSPGDVIDGTVNLTNSDWFRLNPITSGQNMTVEMTPQSDDYALALFTETGEFVDMARGTLNWIAQEKTYYLSITPTPDADGIYTMTVK